MSKAKIKFLKRLDKKLLCPLCQSVFKQPWQTSCGHQFCFECLQALLRYEYFFSRRADNFAIVILFTSSANGCKILKMHMLSSCSAQQTEVKASKKSQLYNLRQATLKCTNYERYTLRLIYLTERILMKLTTMWLCCHLKR